MDLSKAIIAYSLPGNSEFLVATLARLDIQSKDSILSEYDFIISPFDKATESTYLLKFSSIAANRVFSIEACGDIDMISTSFEEYTASYKIILGQITEGQVQKTILSKRKVIKSEVPDLYTTFINLKNTYKSAFTYLFHIPEVGTWMGATPELLANVKMGQILTRAIAGTMKKKSGDLEKVKWGDKEKVEQHIIEDFLMREFKKRNIDIDISPTYTLSAGQVIHICSDIKIKSFDLRETVEIIHPGPALSGMPKCRAIELIKRVEPTSREFYCGYLGPLSKSGAELYANLRCMKIYKDGYCLYVGGGLTKDSDLQKEWEEGELKAKTLESIIFRQIQPTQL